MHAETGSRVGNIGKCAWINGWVSAETMEVK